MHCLLFSLSSFLTPAWPTAGPGRPGHCPPQPPQVSSDEDAASLGRQPSLEAVAIPGEESPEAHRAAPCGRLHSPLLPGASGHSQPALTAQRGQSPGPDPSPGLCGARFGARLPRPPLRMASDATSDMKFGWWGGFYINNQFSSTNWPPSNLVLTLPVVASDPTS